MAMLSQTQTVLGYYNKLTTAVLQTINKSIKECQKGCLARRQAAKKSFEATIFQISEHKMIFPLCRGTKATSSMLSKISLKNYNS